MLFHSLPNFGEVTNEGRSPVNSHQETSKGDNKEEKQKRGQEEAKRAWLKYKHTQRRILRIER